MVGLVKKSKQKLNANAKPLMFSDFEAAVAKAPVAPVVPMPMAFGLAV